MIFIVMLKNGAIYGKDYKITSINEKFTDFLAFYNEEEGLIFIVPKVDIACIVSEKVEQ